MVVIIGIADTPEDADHNAWTAREHDARRQTMAKLIAGHAVEIVYDNGEGITVTVGGVTFTDGRDVYPSEQLVAQVVLAADAAQFNPDAFKIKDFEPEDLVRFEPPLRSSSREARRDLDELAQNNIRREMLNRYGPVR